MSGARSTLKPTSSAELSVQCRSTRAALMVIAKSPVGALGAAAKTVVGRDRVNVKAAVTRNASFGQNRLFHCNSPHLVSTARGRSGPLFGPGTGVDEIPMKFGSGPCAVDLPPAPIAGNVIIVSGRYDAPRTEWLPVDGWPLGIK